MSPTTNGNGGGNNNPDNGGDGEKKKPLLSLSDDHNTLTVNGKSGSVSVKKQETITATKGDSDNNTALSYDVKKGTSLSKTETEGDTKAVESLNLNHGTLSHTKSSSVGPKDHERKASRTTAVSEDGIKVSSAKSDQSDPNNTSSSSNSLTFGPNKIGGSFSDKQTTKTTVDGKEQTSQRERSGSISLSDEEISVSGSVNNNGLGVKHTDDETEVSVGWKNKVGPTEQITAGYNRETETYSGSYSITDSDKNTFSIGGSVSDEKSTGSIGGGNKNVSVKVGGSITNRSEREVGGSSLLDGKTYTMDNLEGWGLNGGVNGKNLGVEGGYETSRQVRTQQQLGDDNALSDKQYAQMGKTHGTLTDGKRLDVRSLESGQGFEIGEKTSWNVGATGQMAMLKASGRYGQESVRSRGMSRTDDGFRIVDSQVDGVDLSGSVGASAVLFDIASGNYDSAYAHQSQLEFALDEDNPKSFDYAQAYVDLGLLPNWDVALQKLANKGAVTRLSQALELMKAPGANLGQIEKSVRDDVAAANDAVRWMAGQEGSQGEDGVTFTGVSETTVDDQSATVAVLGFVVSQEDWVDNDKHERRWDREGNPYVTSALEQDEDGVRKTATASGDANARVALSVQTDNDRTGEQTNLSLSSKAVDMLGAKLNEGSSGEALWKRLSGQAVGYWVGEKSRQEQALEWSRAYPDTRLPPMLEVPAKRPSGGSGPEGMIKLFEKVTSPEAFAELPPGLQVCFVESTLMVMFRTSSSLDALAAISLMDDGEARGAALGSVAEDLIRDEAQLSRSLKDTKKVLGPGGRYAMELAKKGIKVDIPAMDAKDPAAWAEVLGEYYDAARSSHPDAEAILKHCQRARDIGKSKLFNAMIAAHSSADELTNRIAQKSGYMPGERLYRWVNGVLVGHPQQAKIRAYWEESANIFHNQNVIHKEQTGYNLNENPVDGINGLGNSGMPYEERMYYELMAPKLAPITDESELAILRASGAGARIQKALKATDPGALIEALAAFKKDAAEHYDAALNDWALKNDKLLSRNMPLLLRKASQAQRTKITSMTRTAQSWTAIAA